MKLSTTHVPAPQILFALALCIGLAPAALAGSVDIRFVHVSDTHYLVSGNTTQAAWVERINALPTKTLPNSSELVGKIWGVVHTGDIIDAAGDRAAQWTNFVAQFGLDGTDGLLKFPVYEGWGNHDQDTWLAQITSRITARNQTRPGVVNKDGNSHYSWDWGPVHFVQCNIRVGSTTARYNPVQSFQFLTNDLATRVGSSGRPVVLMHHLPIGAGSTEWPQTEKDQYYEAITNYNVVAILWGHTHAYSISNWRGIRTICADSISKGYNLIRITDDKLIVYRRLSTDTWGAVATDTISVPVSKPRLMNFKRNSGKIDLEISGHNCLNYTLQSSTNCLAWENVVTSNSLHMPLKLSVADPGNSSRFYRAMIASSP
jgi:hypothetical protein